MAQHISKHILYCHCRGERIETGLKERVIGHLKKLPVEVSVLSDLCGLAAKEADFATDILSTDREYLVLGCYPRTMKLIIDRINGQMNIPGNFNYVNLIPLSTDEAIERINDFCRAEPGPGSYRTITEDSGWPSWYPVIDYGRCTACGQCADFCLFGVYEKSETRISVVNPEGCKINCPACARICPSTAIIFPKYKNGGVIGGSDEIDEHAEHQRQVQDMENILGNDLYLALERRKAKRRSIIREEAMKKALSERDVALNNPDN